MNLPNTITMARIACVPLFLWILATPRFNGVYGRQELLAALVFLLASLTDGVDGFLARRLNQVTTLGTLLSPLADQLMVATAYISLVKFAPSLVPAWIAVLIVSREFLVTGLRSVATQEGMTLRVRDIGKFKTVVQVISVVSVLLAHRWESWTVSSVVLPGRAIALVAIWLMLAVSLLSAAAYLRAFWMEALRQGNHHNNNSVQPFPVQHPDGKNVRTT